MRVDVEVETAMGATAVHDQRGKVNLVGVKSCKWQEEHEMGVGERKGDG